MTIKMGVSVDEATHVKANGKLERIVSKSGVGPGRQLAPPSKGGFSVTTESGRTISMWEAESYGKEVES